jgi:hypothetical protein
MTPSDQKILFTALAFTVVVLKGLETESPRSEAAAVNRWHFSSRLPAECQR